MAICARFAAANGTARASVARISATTGGIMIGLRGKRRRSLPGLTALGKRHRLFRSEIPDGGCAMAYTITPLTPHTGAEVTDLDLAKPIDAETKAALNRAWARHHVLVIRDQKYEPGDFMRAVQVFGELQPHDKKNHHITGF